MVIKISKLSLLFSVWGIPSKYSKVNYGFDDDNKTYEKMSPIFAIIERYKISNKDAYIFIPSTVLTETEIITKKKINSDDAEEAVKKYTMTYIENAEQDFIYENIRVIPGIGKYKKWGTDISLKITYHHKTPYYQMFHIITDIILGKINSKNYDEIEIMLDQSNGQNFYTTLIYRILKDVSMILAYKYKVSFQVFNCDPVIKGINDSTIHVIESIHVDKYPQITYIKNRSLLGNNKLWKRYNGFIYGIRNCIPLLFLSLYHEIEVEPIINKIQSEFSKSFKIESKNNSVIIDNTYTIPQDFDILLKLKIIKNVIDVQNSGREFSLKDIYTHKFSIEYNKILEYRIEREIKKIIKEISNDDWIDFENPVEWTELIANVNDNKICNYSSWHRKDINKISLRNFVAHMGLEEHCFDLKRAKDDILIYYRNNVINTMIKKIIEHLEI